VKQQSRSCYPNETVQSNVWRRAPAEGWSRLKVLLPSNSLENSVAAANVSRRLRELHCFQAEFEDFVELLCNAAQLGVSNDADTRYITHKHAVQKVYAPVRAFLISFMSSSTTDADSVCEGLCGDPFLALIAPRSVGDFLVLDDGAAISRIQRVRDAIERYERHLSLLRKPRR